MRKLNDHELISFYGGGIIATLFGVAIIGSIVATAYKVLTAEEGKIKIPGGTEISFEKAQKPQPVKQVTRVSRSPQENNPQEIVLKQLNNQENTYYSQSENFLIQY